MGLVGPDPKCVAERPQHADFAANGQAGKPARPRTDRSVDNFQFDAARSELAASSQTQRPAQKRLAIGQFRLRKLRRLTFRPVHVDQRSLLGNRPTL